MVSRKSKHSLFPAKSIADFVFSSIHPLRRYIAQGLPLAGSIDSQKNSSLGNRFQGQPAMYVLLFHPSCYHKQPTITGAFHATPQATQCIGTYSFAPITSCVWCLQARVLSLVWVIHFNFPLSNRVYYIYLFFLFVKRILISFLWSTRRFCK